MYPTRLDALAQLSPAVSLAGLVASAVALYMALKAFAKSRRFNRYADREDEHNLQALEALLRGCEGTIGRILEDPGGRERYFRSLNALLLVLPGALAEYEAYIRQEARRLALDLWLLLLDASTMYSESLGPAGGREGAREGDTGEP